MITITRRHALLMRRVFRRRSLGLARSGAVAPLVLRVDPDAGLRARFQHGDFAVECLLPGSPRPAETLAIPLEILKRLRAAEDSPVVFEADGPTSTAVEWTNGGFPESARCTVPSLRSLPHQPAAPTDWAELPGDLLKDLADLSEFEPSGLLRLGGNRSENAEPEGMRLPLAQGLRYPWTGDVLVYASPVFARRELPRKRPVELGRTATHAVLRAGAWTVWLAIQPEDLIDGKDDPTA